MNKLRGMRCYIAGGIDRISDGGQGWRDWITPQLQKYGVIPINPCKKPIDIGFEDMENREYRQQLLKDGRYDEMAENMRTIRVVDLRLIDISDFLIVYFDTEQQLCGTFEEVFWANRLKRPVLLYCPQGIKNVYHWMWGVLPYKFFFEKWDDLFTYLEGIDNGTDTNHMKRWTWLNYDELTPQLRPATQTINGQTCLDLTRKVDIN